MHVVFVCVQRAVVDDNSTEGSDKHMSSLPFTAQQCFFVAIFIFIVAGFFRGWKRELVSLVFILLGIVLVNPASTNAIGQFLTRLPSTISYLTTGTANNPSLIPAQNYTFGPLGTLIIFFLIIAAGYYAGNQAFPKPASAGERFIGIIPALVSGAAVLYYLDHSGIFASTGNGATFATVFQLPDPGTYIPFLFIVAIVALIVALISNRVGKKGGAKK